MINIPNNLPFRWIGGKKWLNDKLNIVFNDVLLKVNNNNNYIYIEPFCGGLGSFLSVLNLLNKKNINNFILNDINNQIIITYNVIKYKNINLIENFNLLETIFINKSKNSNNKNELLEANEYYLYIRNKYNDIKDSKNEKDEISIASYFLFLMFHCFNGVYRENQKGKFNTPFNWKSTNETNLKNKLKTFVEYNVLFNKINIVFENMDVFNLLNKYNEYNTTILYLDPPYMNEDNKSENKYNKEIFNKEKQLKLLNVINKYDLFIYSNHFVEDINSFVINNTINYILINRKNIMSCKKDTRKNDKIEILAWKN